MSWNTKYRPRQFEDLHLEKVRTQMLQLLAAGKLPQVMLFCGPKGTGKTTTARLIAALLNDESNAKAVTNNYLEGSDKVLPLVQPQTYTGEAAAIFAGESLAVVEIDAASNNGVESVRLLQERLYLPNGLTPMTVYIFDEVHMFSTSAFNAMLKILEEPPRHVIFILATTEKHKIPATVMSRCTVVDFVKASEAELTSVFERVLAKEKVKYDDEALKLLAKTADGSFRDGIKLLEAAAVSGEVTLEEAKKVAGADLQTHIMTLITLIKNKNAKEIGEFFANLRAQGVNEQVFYQQLLLFLHEQWLMTLGVTDGEAVLTEKQALFLLKTLRAMPGAMPAGRHGSPLNFLDLEIAVASLVSEAKSKKSS